jgi:Mn2+/Fe2+ NRAMP family transporter
VKKAVSLVLGVLTSIGGFVEVGSISTAAQAGAEFGFELLWAVPLAALILAVLAEMSGRLAAVGKRSVAAAVGNGLGFTFTSCRSSRSRLSWPHGSCSRRAISF